MSFRITMWATAINAKGAPEYASWMTTHSKIYHKQVVTDCVPQVGDQIVLWPDTDDGDPSGGPMMHVRSRYMAANGRWHISLARVVQDPPPKMQNEIMREISATNGYDPDTWWSEVDGDFVTSLVAGGWSEGDYEEKL